MRRPPKGELWVHVDRLDRDDMKVWAIQEGRKYLTVRAVCINVPCHTAFFGPKAKQPKAVIVVPGGRVEMRGDVAVISS